MAHQRSGRSGSRQAGTHASASASGTAAQDAHTSHVSDLLELRRLKEDTHSGSMRDVKLLAHHLSACAPGLILGCWGTSALKHQSPMKPGSVGGGDKKLREPVTHHVTACGPGLWVVLIISQHCNVRVLETQSGCQQVLHAVSIIDAALEFVLTSPVCIQQYTLSVFVLHLFLQLEYYVSACAFVWA